MLSDNGVGNACQDDFDGDGSSDADDICPSNGNLHSTSLRFVVNTSV